MNILLHACCAPCAIIPAEDLAKEHSITLYWYNPNIHPVKEYLERRKAMDVLAESHGYALLDQKEYDSNKFLLRALEYPENRCRMCYLTRMTRCAELAGEKGFEAFSTSLLYSPYQDHELIKSICTEISVRSGVRFIYRDWRSHYREGVVLSRELKLYRQKYCGCLLSERERYEKKLKKYISTSVVS